MTEVMEQSDVRFTPAEQEKVARIKDLLKTEKKTAWEIGDLVLEICGPAGTSGGMGRLTALAAELNVSTQLLARYRVTSEQFPEARRQWDLPHSAYQQVQAYPAIAETVLAEVAKNLRAYSDTALKETKEATLRKFGMHSRTGPRLTRPERFSNAIDTFRKRISSNQVTLTRSEADEIRGAIRELLPLLDAYAKSRQG